MRCHGNGPSTWKNMFTQICGRRSLPALLMGEVTTTLVNTVTLKKNYKHRQELPEAPTYVEERGKDKDARRDGNDHFGGRAI